MALLKKIEASSLTEVIVAGVIILILFYIAIASVENILVSQAKKEKAIIEKHLDIIEYKLKYNKINRRDTVINSGVLQWKIVILQSEKEALLNSGKYIIEAYDRDNKRVAIRKVIQKR